MAQQLDNQKDQSRHAAGQPDRSSGSQPKTDTNTGMDKPRTPRATEGEEEIASDNSGRDTASRDPSISKSSDQSRTDSPKKAY